MELPTLHRSVEASYDTHVSSSSYDMHVVQVSWRLHMKEVTPPHMTCALHRSHGGLGRGGH
jgi:hypothetical protein